MFVRVYPITFLRCFNIVNNTFSFVTFNFTKMMMGRVSFSIKYANFKWLGSGLSFNCSGSSTDGLFFLSPLIYRSKGSNFFASDTILTSTMSLGTLSLKNSLGLNNLANTCSSPKSHPRDLIALQFSTSGGNSSR